MTRQELDILLKHPGRLTAAAAADLRELTEQYPYFAPVRMLWLRALKLGDSVLFERELARTAVYAHDRRRLCFFLYPERLETPGGKYVRPTETAGGYFDLLDRAEREGADAGGDTSRSLRALAERLKQARLDVTAAEESTPPPPPAAPERDAGGETAPPAPAEDYTVRVRSLIRAERYEEAIAILKELYLNNPKKSIYFADQIRFIEKIIDNKNK